MVMIQMWGRFMVCIYSGQWWLELWFILVHSCWWQQIMTDGGWWCLIGVKDAQCWGMPNNDQRLWVQVSTIVNRQTTLFIFWMWTEQKEHRLLTHRWHYSRQGKIIKLGCYRVSPRFPKHNGHKHICNGHRHSNVVLGQCPVLDVHIQSMTKLGTFVGTFTYAFFWGWLVMTHMNTSR